jgi:hypothetical protein
MFKCETPAGGSAAAALSAGRPSAALGADECSDLKETSCESNAHCSWCESAAVPSACYTVEQATRLPPAVFRCRLPSAAA